MDLSSTSSATSATATPIAQSAASNHVNKTGESSFDEQMKNAQAKASNKEENTNETQAEESLKTESNVDNENKNIENTQNEKTALNSNDKKQKEIDNTELQLTKADLLSLNIKNLLDTQSELTNHSETYALKIDKTVDLTKNIGETLNYDTIEINETDAMFFVNIIENNQAGLQNVATDIKQALDFGTESVQKSAHVSKTLLTALQNTIKTGQAVRIDFGNDIAVIMRVSKDGAVMANFIPGDKAVEQYLKNNIDFLKQRFDEENIPYSQLSYSQHQQQRERQQQNKEDKHE